MSKLTKMPASFKDGIFQEVFELAELNKMSDIDRAIYDSNVKSVSDYENTIRFAVKKAAIKAKKEGIAQEKAKGKIREMKNKIRTAKNLKHRGFSAIQIFEITDLSVSEIKKLS